MSLWTDSRILIPGLIIVASLLGCLLANYLSPYDPSKIALGRPYAQPSLDHPLGLDNAGRDILSRILHGGRLTLGISISSVFIAAFIGTVLGMMAAYFAGLLDTVIMLGHTQIISRLSVVPGTRRSTN